MASSSGLTSRTVSSFPYVLDTYAWIEYFNGSEKGRSAKRYIEGDEVLTPAVVVAEFADKYVREGLDPAERLVFIRTKSRIVDLDYASAELAGRTCAERRKKVDGWGLVDSMVLTAARMNDGKVVTGDRHFADLKEAIMIGGFS
jgi:predicted nucleic acid-binding protein